MMNTFLLSICFEDLFSTPLSSLVLNNDITSLNQYEVAFRKEDVKILGKDAEYQVLKVSATDDQLNNNILTNSIDEDKVTLTSQHDESNAVKSSYIRDEWNLTDWISNSLTLGNLSLGSNSHIKLVSVLVLFLGILMLMLICFYKVFIIYCYKTALFIDNV